MTFKANLFTKYDFLPTGRGVIRRSSETGEIVYNDMEEADDAEVLIPFLFIGFLLFWIVISFGLLPTMLVGPITLNPIVGAVSSFFVLTFIVSGYRYLMVKEVEFLREASVPLHTVVDSIVEWEKGDELAFEHFSGEYVGPVKDGIVLEKEEDGESIKLPSLYVSKYLRINSDLDDRIDKTLKEEVEESNYNEFIEEMSREYERLKSQEEHFVSSGGLNSDRFLNQEKVKP